MMVFCERFVSWEKNQFSSVIVLFCSLKNNTHLWKTRDYNQNWFTNCSWVSSFIVLLLPLWACGWVLVRPPLWGTPWLNCSIFWQSPAAAVATATVIRPCQCHRCCTERAEPCDCPGKSRCRPRKRGQGAQTPPWGPAHAYAREAAASRDSLPEFPE